MSLAGATLRVVVLAIAAVANHQDVEAQDPAKRTYTYKTVRDLLIHADVYRTPDAIIRPAILYIHGGALIMGNRSWLNPVQAPKYLDAGYAIISIDYRLAPQTKLNEIINDFDPLCLIRNVTKDYPPTRCFTGTATQTSRSS